MPRSEGFTTISQAIYLRNCQWNIVNESALQLQKMQLIMSQQTEINGKPGQCDAGDSLIRSFGFVKSIVHDADTLLQAIIR